jgi:hypothetical protein
MAEPQKHPSIEDVFNANLEALLQARGLDHRDLLDLLEKADYTPDTPATVLLNDAIAMAAVLGVSPAQLLVPPDGEAVGVTPALASDRAHVTLWLKGLQPLRDEDFIDFHRQASRDDLDADRVAEMWVRTERVRTAGLTIALNDAVDRRDMPRVKELSDLASRLLNQQALERADGRVPRRVRVSDLQAAVTRATRFRRQTTPRR